MLSIDSLTSFHAAPAYAEPLSRISRTFKRYLVFSGAIASASLAVAVGVSMLAMVYSRNAAPATEARTFPSLYDEVSSANAGASLSTIEEPSLEVSSPGAAAATRDVVAPPQEPPDRLMINAHGQVHNVNITFYDCKKQGFCGTMYNGRKVYQGAAACSWDLMLGTKFVIVGDPTRRVYICEDRGLLSDTWVDIFWNDPRDGRMWQALTGRFGTIDVIELP